MTKKKKKPAQPAPCTAMVVVVVPDEVIDREAVVDAAYTVHGDGGLFHAHTEGDAADSLRGAADDVDLSKVDPNWVLRRLVKEACDLGTRTRQSSRIKALELVGTHLGMFKPNEDGGITDEDRRALSLTPAERRERIRELSRELMATPAFNEQKTG